MRISAIALFLTVLFCSPLFAQNSTSVAEPVTKYLHISTNPSYADAYVNNTAPNHAKEPDYKLPGFIPVPAGEPNIIVSLFRPEYADTTINVTLSKKDTSFLIVSLRPTHDEKITDRQYGELAHRSRKKVGHNLLIASIAPFVVSGVAAAVSYYNIERANDKKDDIDKALIRDSEYYQKTYDKFSDYRDNARKAKKLMNMSLILGGIVFSTGIILSF